MTWPLFLSIVAIIVSVLTWHKNRVVYKVEVLDDRGGLEKVNEMLKTGTYTLLHVKQDPINTARTYYVLGKIKE